ncbi:branched-chain amino acid ABC transporter permease [Candidatus Entotheonella palauensis]|nr:branched-chain amino acid ABC transporter permease [Candidatus Entotheonella palauensis]
MAHVLDLNLLLEQAFNGLIIATGIYLVASGLSLIYGMLGVPNFAHGSLYMYGAFLLFTVTRFMFGNIPWLFWVGLLLVPLIVMILGMGIEVFLLRPIYRADAFYQLLLTYGLVLIFGDLVKMIWGTENQAVSRPPGFEGSMSLFDISLPSYQMLILIPISFLTLVLLYLFIHKTRLGSIIRTVSYDQEMLGALGINVRLLYTGVFAMGTWLAGLGGVVLAPLGAVYPGMDFHVIIDVFLVVVLGGLGSMTGTALGALIYGELRSFGILLTPEFESVFIYVLIVVVLSWRPQGLMGRHLAGGH